MFTVLVVVMLSQSQTESALLAKYCTHAIKFDSGFSLSYKNNLQEHTVDTAENKDNKAKHGYRKAFTNT